MSSNNTEQLQFSSNAENQDMQLITEPLAAGTIGPFLSTVERLGISELPWIMGLAHVDLALSPEQKSSLVNQIASAENEIKHWVKDPFSKDSHNSKAALVIGITATYSLLTAIQLNPTLSRNTCGPSPQPDGCIKLAGNSTDSIVKLYDWPVMVKKSLSALSEMLENPKEQQKADKFFSALEQGDDDLGYLYGIFQKSKNSSKASRIVANFALAAAGLRAAMEGKEIPEKWGRLISKRGRVPPATQGDKPKCRTTSVATPPPPGIGGLALAASANEGRHGEACGKALASFNVEAPRLPTTSFAGSIENVVWTTLCQIAVSPKEIPQAVASLYQRLKEMTRYDKANDVFELEVEPGCREFYKSLESLFYLPTSANDGPASAPPTLAPGTPQTPPPNTSNHPPAAGPSGLNAPRVNSPPPDGPLNSPPNTSSNISGDPDVGIGKGIMAEDPEGSGKRKRGDNDNDERDDDADRRENPNINLDAGKGVRAAVRSPLEAANADAGTMTTMTPTTKGMMTQKLGRIPTSTWMLG
ncbi:hypothetical protein IMY05_C4635000300 [Salix suchowensis]|nr:hypothetical protein IMY05_C4635000300 [Salix suchowensis]